MTGHQPFSKLTKRFTPVRRARVAAKVRTKGFTTLAQSHVKADKKFAEVLLNEAVNAMLSGDLATGKTILRGYLKPRSASRSSAPRPARRPKA